MNNQPLVSCIMPTANRRQFVPQAIRYFLDQDYPNKELIILDDGSDPVGELIPHDERIRYIQLQQKTTVGAKRNLACQQAHGELIAHWDDDDWHAPHRIRYQVEQLLHSGREVCGLNHLLFYHLNSGQAWQYIYPPGRRFWLNGSTLCYRRSFWARHPFDNLNIGEDARFVWSGRPEQMLVLTDSTFHVGIIHDHNVAPKKTNGAYWQALPVETITAIMKEDWPFYRLPLVGSSVQPQRPMSTRVQNSKEVKPMSTIAVVVTCHAPYLKWLPETLASIDRQIPAPTERVIAFDRCQPPPTLNPHWRAIGGDWGHPSFGRNAGLAATTAPWLIFWDADNIMPEGYIAAMQQTITAAASDLAIVYPDIHYCDDRLTPQHLWQTPVWDYWEMRANNCVDTASAWRREALDLVGNWRVGVALEDYILALNVTAAGWKAAKSNGPPILKRTHSNSRSEHARHEGKVLTDLWKARSLAIVTLLAGRENVLDQWLNFLLHAELPPKTALYVVDNSGRPEFTERAYAACQQVASARDLSHLNFATSDQAYSSAGVGADFIRDRHRHVARLYTSLLPRVTEDLILTLEDDVEPPLDAVRRLGEEIGWSTRSKIGAVAAAYPMAENPSLVCAGRGQEQWGPAIAWSQVSSEAFDVGCVGGGCTMWANWALHHHPVNFWWEQRLGWDAAFCITMRRKGYRIRLHGGVRCQHHAHGRVNNQTGTRSTKQVRGRTEKVKVLPIHQNTDSWLPLAEIGTRIPPYKPTFDFTSFINERHRTFSTCAVQNGFLINIGIPGWLRREDALKLYELAYFTTGDILELGCYQGLSTSILAQAIKDSGRQKSVFSIDLEASHLASAEKQIRGRGLGEYVKFICGDGAEVCQTLIRENRQWGFIFIDHSHKYQAVVDVCQLLPKLLLNDGFCMFHDFNDGRSNDQNQAEYKVPQAVHDSLNKELFVFYGIFGCSAVYKRRHSNSSETD